MRMVYHQMILFILGACVLCAPDINAQEQWFQVYPYDFALSNAEGDSIVYCLSMQYEDAVVIGPMTNNESLYRTDSLVIPDSVIYDGITYPVVGCGDWAFFNSPAHVKSVTLPRTYIGCDTAILNRYVGGTENIFRGTFAGSRFERIYVKEDNPFYCSIDGVLYDKDISQLIAYPPEKQDTSYSIASGIHKIEKSAFLNNSHLRHLDTPNTLHRIESFAFYRADSLKEIVLKDSLQYLGILTITGSTNKIVLGNRISIINEYFWDYTERSTILSLTIYTTTPPLLEKNGNTFGENKLYGSEYIHLYVPRKSLHLYQQAAGWKDCASILPIEPPIVTGVDTASVSWVQNFSATGYVWTLYTDEAKTQRFMSLTFDANGHLTNIDINSGLMPARMPALYSENGEEERRFAEYYSFTISGLSPYTRYYYTRQSLNGTEVIDEETGSFETQSNEPTGLNGCENITPAPQKFLENGQMLIRSGNATYNVQGSNIRE